MPREMRALGLALPLFLIMASANGGTLMSRGELFHGDTWSQVMPLARNPPLPPVKHYLGQYQTLIPLCTIRGRMVPSSSEIRNLTSLFHCTRNGVYSKSGSCRDYFQCEELSGSGLFAVYLLSCPLGTVFDNSLNVCDLASRVTSRPECMTEETTSNINSNRTNSGLDIDSLIDISVNNPPILKRQKRIAIMTVLTGLIAAGSLASAAAGITGAVISNKKSGGSGVDLRSIEHKLMGIDGKIKDVQLSVLESQITNRINSEIIQNMISKGTEDNRVNFKVTQNLINQGILENRISTAAIQGLIAQGNIDNELNFAKVQVSIGELKQFINHEITSATADIKKGFEKMSNSIDHSRTEPLVSKLLTIAKGFSEKLNHLKSLPEKNQKDEIERSGGYLEYLESSTLQDTLYDIIHQNFAIPISASDISAVFILDLLVHGLQIHASMLSSIVSSNVYLAAKALDEINLDEFNTYMLRVSSSTAKVKSALGHGSRQGLIGEVTGVLNKVGHLPYTSDIHGLNELLTEKKADLEQLESDVEELIIDNTELSEPGTIRRKIDFTNTFVSVPIGPWETGKRVSYAVQFISERGLSQIGEWSTPYTIQNKANPTIQLPRAEYGVVSALYRRFDHEKPELVAVVRDNEQTLLRDIGRDILNAAARPNEELAVKEMASLIDDGADVNISIEKKMTPLHYAARNGNMEVMNILIGKGADIYAKASDNEEPLHFAALFGAEEGVEYLISKGARINAQTRSLGLSSLHIAVDNGHVDAAKALIRKGAFINIKDNNGLTPLHFSIAGNRDIIDVLLESETLDVNAVTKYGLTPLHYATRSTNDEFVRKLLQHDDINVNALSDSLLSPLHLAAMNGDVSMILELLQHGATVSATDKYGSIPLHYAAFYGNQKAALVLVREDPSMKNIKNNEHKTALDLAVENNREAVTEILSCPNEVGEQMAKSSEETCAHIGNVESYVNLVMSMIPLEKYQNQEEHQKIFQEYDIDLGVAQGHAKIWRNGDSIVKGIQQTFELAKEFELEFREKYGINKERVEEIKENMDQVKIIDETSIKDLKQQLVEATEAMNQAKGMPAVAKYFQDHIPVLKRQIAEKQGILDEDLALNGEMEELVGFLEFVRDDSSNIKTIAVEARERTETFRDNLQKDKSTFDRHKVVANRFLEKLQQDTIDNNQMMAECKVKQESLKGKIKEEKEQIDALQHRISESQEQIKDLEKKISDGGNYIFNLWLYGFYNTDSTEKDRASKAIKEEKANLKALNSTMNNNQKAVDNLIAQRNATDAEIKRFKKMIADSESKSEKLKNEMNDFITLDGDLKLLADNADTLVEAINKAIVGVMVIKDAFDDVTKKLSEMIDSAKAAKTEAERLNAKYFIYNKLSLLECNWRDVYIKVIYLDECT